MGPESNQPPAAPERKYDVIEAMKARGELEVLLKKVDGGTRKKWLVTATDAFKLDAQDRSALYFALFDELQPLPVGADADHKLAFQDLMKARLAVFAQAEKVQTEGKAAEDGLKDALSAFNTAHFDYVSTQRVEAGADHQPEKTKRFSMSTSEMEGLLVVMDFRELAPGTLTADQQQMAADRAVLMRLLIGGGQTDLPPLPPGATPELTRQWETLSERARTMNEFFSIIRDRGVTEADIKLIRKTVRQYEIDRTAYLAAREAACPNIIDRVMSNGRVPPEQKGLVVEIVQGYSPMMPNNVGGPLKLKWNDLYTQFLTIRDDAHQIALGNVLQPNGALPDKLVSTKTPVNADEFKKKLAAYAVAKAEYDKANIEVMLPFVKTAMREAFKEYGGVEFTDEECTLLIELLRKPLPQPPADERLAEPIRAYYRNQYETLEALRNTANFNLWFMQVKAEAKKPVGSKTYAEFADSAVRYLVLADEYADDVGKARVPDSLIAKAAKLSGALVLLQQGQKLTARIWPPRPDFIPESRRVALKAEYDKLLEDFKKRPGVDLKKFPTFERMMALEKSGLVRAGGAEIWKAVSHLGPTEAVLLALVMYMSRDKIKGGTEFILAMGAIGMVNAAALPFERRMLRQAMRGKTSLAARTFTRVKGPWFVKAAAIVGVLIAGEEVMDDVGEWVSDKVPHNGARKFVEDFGHVLGGPIIDKVTALPDALMGLAPTGVEPALAYLIEKRSAPIIQKYCRTPKDFNALVERGIRLGDHNRTNLKMAEFYRLEKIDLADDYQRNIDVSTPIDPEETKPEGSFDTEYGDYRQVKDWRASRYVSRMALRTRGVHGVLAAEQAQLQAFIESKQLAIGSVPSLGDFVCDPRVPIDNDSAGLNVDDRLLRAVDGSYSSDSPVAAESKAIADFSKQVADSGNDELKKYWKAHVKNAAELAQMVSMFRFLGVYDRDYWFQNQQFIMRGVVSEIEYRKRKEQASLRLGASLKPIPLGAALIEDLLDPKKPPLPPKEKLQNPVDPGKPEDNKPEEDPSEKKPEAATDEPNPAADPEEGIEKGDRSFGAELARAMAARLPKLKEKQQKDPYAPFEMTTIAGLGEKGAQVVIGLKYVSLGGKDVILARPGRAATRELLRPTPKGPFENKGPGGRIVSVPQGPATVMEKPNIEEFTYLLAWSPGMKQVKPFLLEGGTVAGLPGGDYTMKNDELFALRASPSFEKADAYDRILRTATRQIDYDRDSNDTDYARLLDEKLGDLIRARKLDFDDPRLLRAFAESVATAGHKITAANWKAILADIERRLGPAR